MPASSSTAALAAAFLFAQAAAPPATPPLTANGWGALKIGMREADAVRQFHLVVPKDDGVSSDECRELSFPSDGPGLTVMAQHGRITRISAYGPTAVRTDKGFGVGSREAAIRHAYGHALKVAPHAYEEARAHYLTAWAGKRGVRYETNRRGVVTTMHAGDKSIELAESCL